MLEEAYSGIRLQAIVTAAYIIGSVIGIVLIIAVILTALQRALLLRDERRAASSCQDDRCRATSTTAVLQAAADRPPTYDEAVLGSPSHTTSSCTAGESTSMSQHLLATETARPPCYDDVENVESVAK